jgi:hypothetical protein
MHYALFLYRSDHHLQYLRDKLFPIKRKRKSERDAPNPVSPIQIQTQKVKERSLSSVVAAAVQSKTYNRLYDLPDDSSSPPLIGNAKKKSEHTKLKEEENMGPCEGSVMTTYTRRQVNQI